MPGRIQVSVVAVRRCGSLGFAAPGEPLRFRGWRGGGHRGLEREARVVVHRGAIALKRTEEHPRPDSI